MACFSFLFFKSTERDSSCHPLARECPTLHSEARSEVRQMLHSSSHVSKLPLPYHNKASKHPQTMTTFAGSHTGQPGSTTARHATRLGDNRFT